MPITELQRAERHKYVGSSDAPALLGCDPYKSAYDIWLDKLGLLEAPQEPNEAAEIGNMVEDSLLDWAASELGYTIRKNQRRVHIDGILAANHDALAVSRANVGLEAKTSGILNAFAHRDDWGESGTDQVPDRVIVQCHHQMIVSDLDVVWVPALIGGRGRVLYKVERNAELYDAVLRACTEFWVNHVVPKVEPVAAPTLAIIKRRQREPGLAVVLEQIDIINEWTAAKEKLKAAEAEHDRAQALVLAAMGAAEAADTPLGRITYMEQTRTSIDTKALKAAHPDICKEFEKSSAYRVLRFKAAK